MNTILETFQRHGFPALVAGLLLWFLMSVLSTKLDAHITETTELIRLNKVMCINLAKLAKSDPVLCERDGGTN